MQAASDLMSPLGPSTQEMVLRPRRTRVARFSGSALAFLLAVAAVFIGVSAVVFFVKGVFPLGLIACLFVGAALYVASLCNRQPDADRPFMRLTPAGMQAHGLKDSNLPWDRILEIRLSQSQGDRFLTVFLVPDESRPRPGIFGRRNDRRRISLGGLHVAEQRQVYEDVLRAFERWAPDVTRPEVAAQLANVRAEKDFETGLQQATPHAWGMASMVALCIGVWAGGVLTGVNAWKPDIDALLHWGGNATSLVQGGEWWRLGSGMFMHGGIVHLALNMIVLWITGRLLTRWFGNSGFLLVYLGSGLVGSALSLHFAAQLHVVVGASGAVFGVLGAVLVCLLLHRDRFPIRDSKRLLVSMASFAVYSLVQGFVQPGIDNAGHVGGLLAGVVLGRLLIAKFDTAAAPTARWRRWGLGAAGCLAAIVVVGVTAPPAARDMATFRGNIQVMQAVMSEIGDKAKAMQQRQPEMRRNMEMGRMSAAQFAQQILQGPGRSMRQGADRLAALNWGRDDPFGRYAQAQAANLIATADLIDFNIQVASGGNALTGEVKQKEAALTAKVRATQQTVIDQTKQLLSEAQLQALPAAEQQALHVTPAANAR